MTVTLDEVAERRRLQETETPEQVLFTVAGLYGLSKESVRLPVSPTKSIDSGQICVTIDPGAEASGNVGMVDFDRRHLRVRYGVQIVFPGLHDLVMGGDYDLSLLSPPRAVATDDCTVTPDLDGWRALGCIDFLPGSLWAGAAGG